MGGSASEEFLAPDGGRRGLVRALHQLRLRGQHRGRAVAARRRCRSTRRPRRTVADTPDTPTIQTLVDLINDRDDLRRVDRDWTAADTLKNVVVKLRHPDGRVEPLAVGVPGDREVDMKRLEAQLGPAEIEPFTEADFAANKHLVKGYIGPGALGAGQAGRNPLPRRPADRRRHPVGHRSRSARSPRALPHRRARLRRRRHGRGRRSDRRRPVPGVPVRRSRSPVASRSATSSSSVASTPPPSVSTCSTRTASNRSSRWVRTASACLAPLPRSPR